MIINWLELADSEVSNMAYGLLCFVLTDLQNERNISSLFSSHYIIQVW